MSMFAISFSGDRFRSGAGRAAGGRGRDPIESRAWLVLAYFFF